MLKGWRSKFSTSSSLIASEVHETLLNEEEQDVFDTTRHSQPRQNKNPALIIYWIYFIYGVAMLLPWNVFITASDYFSYRFTGSAHQSDFQNYFSAYSNCSNLISLAVFLWLGQKKILPKIDVLLPLSVNSLIFLFYAITSVMAIISAVFYFKITIFFMVVAGITTSILQLTVFADASQLPPKYVQAVMSGQGIAGVSVALFSFLTSMLGGDVTSVFYYFFTALLVTLVGMTGRIVLHRQPSYRLMMYPISVSNNEDDRINMTSFSVEEEDDVVARQNSFTVSEKGTMWDIVFKKSPGYVCTVIYIYIITLALFPSITTQVTSVNEMESSIFISLHFLLFDIGDWIGRTLPIWKSFQVYSSKILLVLSLLRTLFIPVFLNCNITTSSGSSGWIQSDFLFFISILLFSISNGWLTSLVFMAAPKQYDMSTKPLVGSIMSFSLVIGLALGGLSSFLVSKIFL